MGKYGTWVLTMCFVVLTGCGGGSSSSDAGGGGTTDGEATIPADIAGSYKGTWNGSGNDGGPFTCSGTFSMSISQSASSLVVKLNVLTGTGQCDQAFEFSGGGTYNTATGEISISTVSEETTASLTGTATEVNLVIGISGQWSIVDSASSAVVASGTWTADPI